MNSLISKDDDLGSSAPIVGFEILKMINDCKETKVSIFDIAKDLRKHKNISPRSIYYGVIFLYSLDIIDFHEPYLIINAANTKTI